MRLWVWVGDTGDCTILHALYRCFCGFYDFYHFSFLTWSMCSATCGHFVLCKVCYVLSQQGKLSVYSLAYCSVSQAFLAQLLLQVLSQHCGLRVFERQQELGSKLVSRLKYVLLTQSRQQVQPAEVFISP